MRSLMILVVALASVAHAQGVPDRATHPQLAVELTGSAFEVTRGEQLTVGETGEFAITVNLPVGEHPDLRVIATPPPGLQIVSVRLELGQFDGAIPDDPTGVVDAEDGEAVAFDLGRVVVPDDAFVHGSFRLVMTARADATRLVIAGRSEQRAALSIDGRTVDRRRTEVDLVVPVPRLTSRAVLDPRDPTAAIAQVTLENAGDGPLCDTELTLSVPPLYVVSPGDDALDNDSDGLVDEEFEVDGLLPGLFVVPVSGCIPPGATARAQLRYRRVDPEGHGLVPVVGGVGAYGVMPSAPEQLDPCANGFDTNGDGELDEPADDQVWFELPLERNDRVIDLTPEPSPPGEGVEPAPSPAEDFELADVEWGGVEEHLEALPVLPLTADPTDHLDGIQGGVFAGGGAADHFKGGCAMVSGRESGFLSFALVLFGLCRRRRG